MTKPNNHLTLASEHAAAFEESRGLVERLAAALLQREQPTTWGRLGSLQAANHHMRVVLHHLQALTPLEASVVERRA